MKLAEIVRTQGYQTPRSKDAAQPFEFAASLAERRARLLEPEDRTVKPSKFLFAGQTTRQIDGHEFTTDYLREAGSTREYLLTENAFSQLASRVGPQNGERLNFPGYLRVCDEKLRMLNLNAWLQKNGGQEVFMRTVKPYGQAISRAFLSDSYVDVDDLDLFEVLRKIPDAAKASVRMVEFTESTMHLRLTWKTERQEIKVGDVVEYGVHISNSEIGHRAIRVEPVVFRLVCANGMISGGKEGGDGSYYIRHQGRKERVVGAMQEAISSALPAARELAVKFSAAVKEVIEKPVERLKSLAKEEGLTEAQLTNAIEEMLGEAAGKDVTRADFVNGLTGAGRREGEAGNPDKRYELERMGAKYLERALPLPLVVAA